jgi:hypothetical protein
MASSVQGQVQALASRQKVQLVAGAVAGPLFVAVSLAQIPFRDGFDMTRHAFSFLLNGPGGWLQTINFVVTGALFLFASPGLRAGLGGRAGVVAGVLLGIVGCGLVVAGLFAPQPSYGYPPGAPDGMPTNLTASSILHGIAFITAVLAYCATLAVTAWRLPQSFSWLFRPPRRPAQQRSSSTLPSQRRSLPPADSCSIFGARKD